MNSLLILLVIIALFLLLSLLRSLQMRREIQTALRSGARVIDLRSPREYADGHFSTAINIPHTEIERRLDEIGVDKRQPVILYCHAGTRSAIAQQILRRNGYTGVINARSMRALRRFEPSNQA